ncbi:hypothetical protein COLO4_00742, partial [Corchorus olitorius]
PRRHVEVPVGFLSDRLGGLGALSGSHLADAWHLPAPGRPARAVYAQSRPAGGAGPVPARLQPVVHQGLAIPAAGRGDRSQLPCPADGDGAVGAVAQGVGEQGAVGRGIGELRRGADHRPSGRGAIHPGSAVALRLGNLFLLLPDPHPQAEPGGQPDRHQLLHRAVQHPGDERPGAVVLDRAKPDPRPHDLGLGYLRHARPSVPDPGLPPCAAGHAGAVQLLPDRLRGVDGHRAVRPEPGPLGRDRHCHRLPQRPCRSLAAKAPLKRKRGLSTEGQAPPGVTQGGSVFDLRDLARRHEVHP